MRYDRRHDIGKTPKNRHKTERRVRPAESRREHDDVDLTNFEMLLKKLCRSSPPRDLRSLRRSRVTHTHARTHTHELSAPVNLGGRRRRRLLGLQASRSNRVCVCMIIIATTLTFVRELCANACRSLVRRAHWFGVWQAAAATTTLTAIVSQRCCCCCSSHCNCTNIKTHTHT